MVVLSAGAIVHTVGVMLVLVVFGLAWAGMRGR
jgi:hypothetical protein